MDAAPCRPFDAARAGMSASEAAAVVVLEPESKARARGTQILGRLHGWGLANDAVHPTAPARDGAGLARAVEAAMSMAGVGASSLGHVHAHGTATVFNDAMEVQALTRALGPAARDVPVTTLKGTIGHTFGAAGLVETIASLEAVRSGSLPAIRGLVRPDGALRFVREPWAVTSPWFLKVGAGFGGFDAAVVFEGAAT
jgi:3-oxoacyl-[acyl-carrier-protein] synthase II